jgi:hypothetical protein
MPSSSTEIFAHTLIQRTSIPRVPSPNWLSTWSPGHFYDCAQRPAQLALELLKTMKNARAEFVIFADGVDRIQVLESYGNKRPGGEVVIVNRGDKLLIEANGGIVNAKVCDNGDLAITDAGGTILERRFC